MRIRDRMDNVTRAHSDCNLSRRRLLGALGTLAAVPALGVVPGGVEASESLQAQVNRLVKAMRRRGLVSADERTAWSVYDFTTLEKLVAINEDTPLQAASMIKPFVAQAFFYQHVDGKVGYSGKVRRVMEAMITRSSNPATNYLMGLVSRHAGGNGPRDVERVLKSHAPGIFQHTRIVETIPPGGRTYRNKASAHDYSRFLYGIWNERLPYAKELKEIMALPNRDRIQDGVEEMPAATMIYDKTGTTARMCGNMGIVEALGKNGRRYPYTFIAVIDKRKRARNYGAWATKRAAVIREVSGLVYREMKRRHALV